MPDSLDQRFEAWLQDLAAETDALAPDGTRVDMHVHAGIDAGSGLEMTFGAIDHQLEVAGVDRALLIPLNASDGYHRDNLRLIARAAKEPDRFRALYRIDPTDPDLTAHVAEGFAAGAAGLKLHPFSDRVSPTDPRIAGALELAAEHEAIVLVHTGVEVEHASADTVEAARRYTDARFVFGHLPADKLIAATKAAAELDNVFTCLSWWGPHDVSLALTFTDPARIVVGTDPPYGNVVVGFTQAIRVARALGLDDHAVRAILGGTATDMLAKAPLTRVEPRAIDLDAAVPALLPGPARRNHGGLEGR
jgi:predicted TIM-barrel fold metal-dependent hydrolase